MAKKDVRSTRRGEPEPRIRELYASLPEAFVAARDALARTLAAEGSAFAAEVRRLRRPTLAVWLLNAVARERPDIISALLGAGDRLRQAQIRAMAGAGGGPVREAGEAFRAAVAAAVAAGRELAARADRPASASLLQELERGLRAAATAEVTERDALTQGVLGHLPEPSGLEGLSGLTVLAPGRRSAGEESTSLQAGGARAKAERQAVKHDGVEHARKADERRARAQAAQRERARRKAATEIAHAERALRASEERLRGAERRLEQSQQHVASAREDLAAAHGALETARARARAADV